MFGVAGDTFDQPTHRYAFECLQRFREAGLIAELYPDPVKIKKQMKYADARQAPYTLLIGAEEMNSGKLSLKNMKSGEQQALEIGEVIDLLKKK